jgi:hypothetical protein
MRLLRDYGDFRDRHSRPPLRSGRAVGGSNGADGPSFTDDVPVCNRKTAVKPYI